MTTEHPNGEGKVSYTVKELLAHQDGKLDSIILSLNTKADRTEVVNLAGRVGTLETLQAQQQGSSGFSRWAVPALISFLSLLVSGSVLVVSLIK